MKILVIDDSSSGNDLVASLKSRDDVELIIENPPHAISINKDGSMSDPWAVGLRNNYLHVGLKAVIPGSESGVSIAEWLGAELHLPHNGKEKIWHRRHKQGMIDIALEHGLRAPRSVLIDDRIHPTTFRLPSTFPQKCVVKPVSSGGSDNVHLCQTQAEIVEAIYTIQHSTTLLGEVAPSVTVQEYISGPQYFVNTVSVEGRHLVTEVFRYGIREDSGTPHIYSAITIATDDPLYRGAVEYTFCLLDALDVKFGASHVELRFSEGQWVLIEHNGRCMGPEVPEEVYIPIRGFSQISVLADAVTKGIDGAAKNLAEGHIDSCVAWLMPTPHTSGTLEMFNSHLVRELSTLRRISRVPAIGSYIDTSNRVTTGSCGMIFLGGKDRHVVEEDLTTLEELDHQGALFTIR